MLSMPHIRRAIAYFWAGPPDLPGSLSLEWRFVAVRWLGIMFVAPGLLLAGITAEQRLAAYIVLLVAAIYNVAVQLTMRRWPELFVSGYMTAIGDALLNIAMVGVGGGFDSPFYYLLFTVTISAAMRYGYGPAMAMVLTYVLVDGVETLRNYGWATGPFIFRSGFLFLTALLASYLRELARKAEIALQVRLRQADLLNEATAMLGASLEFEPALHSVVAAAAHLFGSHHVALLPSADLTENQKDSRVIYYDERRVPSEVTGQTEELLRQWARHASSPVPAGYHLQWEAMPSGWQALALRLSLPTRQASLATLAVVVPAGQTAPDLAPDILNSFAERTALTIENASLYRALALRSVDLQRAYGDLAIAHQELLGLDEMKTNFLANVSHELRTPLSSIRAFSELLLSYDDESVRTEFLGIINSESERLSRLVNDVLDITKIESGHMEWHMDTVDLASVLNDSARTFTTLIEKQNLTFHQQIAEDLPLVYGDRDRLQQVVGNLLGNAVKFAPGGTVTLTAGREGDVIYVSVSDNGIGIAPEDRDRVFEKFQQVGDTLTEKPQGTGLGLAICKDIVEHHRGHIWVESQLGSGSTFTFTLPVYENEAPYRDLESGNVEPAVARA